LVNFNENSIENSYICAPNINNYYSGQSYLPVLTHYNKNSVFVKNNNTVKTQKVNHISNVSNFQDMFHLVLTNLGGREKISFLLFITLICSLWCYVEAFTDFLLTHPPITMDDIATFGQKIINAFQTIYLEPEQPKISAELATMGGK
jgi:hypothetical protein